MLYYLRFCVALVILAAPGMAHSQIELALANDQCAARLQGQITSGDFERFVDFIDGIEIGSSENLPYSQAISQSSLCLDSPGGNLLEGLLIAQEVFSRGIPTLVEEDAECYSSCAIIFMSGRIFGLEADGVRRELHVGGRLGFHAPYFDLAGVDQLSSAEAMRLVDIYRLSMHELVRLSNRRTAFSFSANMSSTLLEALLDMGPGEIEEVDTINEVMLWGIQLLGLRDEVPGDQLDLRVACTNFQSWVNGRFASNGSSEWARVIEDPQSFLTGSRRFQNLDHYQMIYTGGYVSSYCLIGMREGLVSRMGICSQDDFRGVSYGDCENHASHSIPWWAALPPETRLADLPQNLRSN